MTTPHKWTVGTQDVDHLAIRRLLGHENTMAREKSSDEQPNSERRADGQHGHGDDQKGDAQVRERLHLYNDSWSPWDPQTIQKAKNPSAHQKQLPQSGSHQTAERRHPRYNHQAQDK